MTKRKADAPINVTGTTPDNMELHAKIMEMRYGLGMRVNNIARFLNMSHPHVGQILKKYRPRDGDKDITMIIRSKL